MSTRTLLPVALALAALALSCNRGAPAPEAPAKRPAPPAVQPEAHQEAPPQKGPEVTDRSRLLTDTARILAGLTVEGDGPLAAIQERPSWKAHARILGNLWKQHEAARLSKVRRWSDANLGAIRASSSTVFYPFGGPDILYATAFYPDAQAYVLVGLEPVGSVPGLMALPPESLDKSLKEMETYITPILQISFFRTNDMEEELTQKGTLPILLVFLAGTGHRILDVQPLALAADGTPVAPQGPGVAHAVRVDFQKEGAASTQSLYYFSQDLSDAALKKVPQFTAFLQKMPRPTTFLKAASYLMFRDHFSTVRTFILTGTAAVLEDDSGIPLKYFQSKKWDVRFYGTYKGPIKLFKMFEQKDLLEAYHGAGTVAPLDFGIGYQHHAGESNLMLATIRP